MSECCPGLGHEEIALCCEGFWIVPVLLVQRQEFLEVRPRNQIKQQYQIDRTRPKQSGFCLSKTHQRHINVYRVAMKMWSEINHLDEFAILRPSEI